jgi:hypothetical protein
VGIKWGETTYPPGDPPGRAIAYLQAGLPENPSNTVVARAGARRALRAIERGEASEEQFAAVGDDWDVEERALAVLLGLAGRLTQTDPP